MTEGKVLTFSDEFADNARQAAKRQQNVETRGEGSRWNLP
jgi:hypothetical protein